MNKEEQKEKREKKKNGNLDVNMPLKFLSTLYCWLSSKSQLSCSVAIRVLHVTQIHLPSHDSSINVCKSGMIVRRNGMILMGPFSPFCFCFCFFFLLFKLFSHDMLGFKTPIILEIMVLS